MNTCRTWINFVLVKSEGWQTPHLIFNRKFCVRCFCVCHLLSFFLAGQDEEACAAGHAGGDCTLGTVLHPAAGKTHLHQLGQGDSSLGSHLSLIQGQWKQFVKVMLRLLANFFCMSNISYFVALFLMRRDGCVVCVVTLMGTSTTIWWVATTSWRWTPHTLGTPGKSFPAVLM